MTNFGLQVPSFTFDGVPDDRMFERIAETAVAAERSGFDSFWVMDHYHQIRSVGAKDEPMLEAYTLLAAVAARTSRIKLGAMVTGVTYRNPAFLAKVVTTLDIVSSGRAILGIGAARNEEESRAYGYEWPPVAERMERLEDALQICRAMFTHRESTFAGRRHHVDGSGSGRPWSGSRSTSCCSPWRWRCPHAGSRRGRGPPARPCASARPDLGRGTPLPASALRAARRATGRSRLDYPAPGLRFKAPSRSSDNQGESQTRESPERARKPMSQRELEALERLEELLEAGRAVRTTEDLDGLLESTAQAIADVLEFDAVVINLRRPAWDDFEVVTVLSPDPHAAETLRGSRNRMEDLAPLLNERFRRGRAFLARMPASEVHLGAVVVPDIPIAEDDDSWGATDWLLVPMRGAGGRLLGILSVDQPRSGKRPSSDELRLLASFTTVATLAVENAKRAAAAEEHRLALERLFEISSGLVQALSVHELLDGVCRGVSDALGFGKVAVELADPQSALLRAQAAAGWRLDDEKFRVRYRLADIEPLMDPAFEIVGCYLLPSDIARERVAGELISYTSSNNGVGPEAWNHHWLFVPLLDSTRRPIGVMWVDDPVDLLLPSVEKLQALRTFADQATIAIESHARMQNLAHAGEARRALLKRIVQASEGERLRMAAGLHDGPVQRLTALMLRLQSAMIALDHGRMDRAHDIVGAMQPALGDEIAKLRTLMVELRPPVLDTMGVMAALSDHVARMDLGEADVRIGSDVRPMDRESETVMYRIAQEAIANAVQHANAAHVDVSLGECGEDVVLEVRDDGVGFDLDEAAASGHFGLAGMRERADMVGGALEITSAPGTGTIVTLRIPATIPGGTDAPVLPPEPSTLGA